MNKRHEIKLSSAESAAVNRFIDGTNVHGGRKGYYRLLASVEETLLSDEGITIQQLFDSFEGQAR